MTDEHAAETEYTEEDVAPVVFQRPPMVSAELDITPMIDIVFLLLIFFLVASVPDPKTAVKLPPARYGEGVAERSSVIITVAEEGDSGRAQIFLGDGKVGPSLAARHFATKEEQAKAIEAYVRESKKSSVIIKGERRVKHGDVAKVTAAVGRVPNVSLHVAVLESD